MRTLTRYIGRDVLASTLLIFLALIGLFTFFDLINEMRDVGRGNYGLTNALLFVALHIPSRIYELFPVAALIGTLFAISQFVANSEFTVMRASGASIVQVGWAVLRVGIPLAIATFLAGEYVAPPAERLAQNVRAAAMGNATGVVAQQFESGFWFKQDYTFVNIRTVLADMTLVGVRIYEFDRDLRLTAVRSAESGRFAGDGRWQLEKVSVTEIGRDATTVSSDADVDVAIGAAAVDPHRLPGRAGAARAVDAVRQHPRARAPARRRRRASRSRCGRRSSTRWPCS